MSGPSAIQRLGPGTSRNNGAATASTVTPTTAIDTAKGLFDLLRKPPKAASAQAKQIDTAYINQTFWLTPANASTTPPATTDGSAMSSR
ncbi:MAG: hypothetical protein ACRCV9_00835 [Burkholderiaceae bacterium]